MKTNLKTIYFLLLPLLFALGCSSEMPDSSSSAEFLFDHPDIKKFEEVGHGNSKITLTKKSSFGDTEDVFYKYIFRLSVDDSGKVYLNNDRLHVYNPDGSYHASIGEKGNGPGEFQVIHNYLIKNNKLYVYDAFLYRISVFSINNFTLIQEVFLETPKGMRGFGEFEVYQNEEILVGLERVKKRPANTEVTPDEYMSYYKISSSGKLVNRQIYKTKIKGSYSINTERIHASGDIPDDRTTLMEMGKDDTLYLLWTDDLAIKIYGAEGEKLGGIYYPLHNVPIQDSLKKDYILQEIGEHYPKTYQAVEQFLVDDEDNLWVASVSENKKIYKWMVLNDEGKLLTTFIWPRSKVIHAVKKGLAYTIEKDQESGIYTAYSYNIKWS